MTRCNHGRECHTTPCLHLAGELALLETMRLGMVPVKVLEVLETGYGWRVAGGDYLGLIRVKVTATRGAYKRGEVLEVKASTLVPRCHHRYVRGSGRISNQYVWRVTAGLVTYTVTSDAHAPDPAKPLLVMTSTREQWHVANLSDAVHTGDRYIATH